MQRTLSEPPMTQSATLVERLTAPRRGCIDDIVFEVEDLCTEAAAHITELEAERDRITRNRDMWKGQVERQAAQLERVRAETWQPIETAPRDGTAIIGAFWSIRWADSHRRGEVVRCWYQPEFEAFISSCREMTLAHGYTFEKGGSRQLHSPVIEPVTHWIKMPPPESSNPGQKMEGV